MIQFSLGQIVEYDKHANGRYIRGRFLYYQRNNPEHCYVATMRGPLDTAGWTGLPARFVRAASLTPAEERKQLAREKKNR